MEDIDLETYFIQIFNEIFLDKRYNAGRAFDLYNSYEYNQTHDWDAKEFNIHSIIESNEFIKQLKLSEGKCVMCDINFSPIFRITKKKEIYPYKSGSNFEELGKEGFGFKLTDKFREWACNSYDILFEKDDILFVICDYCILRLLFTNMIQLISLKHKSYEEYINLCDIISLNTYNFKVLKEITEKEKLTEERYKILIPCTNICEICTLRHNIPISTIYFDHLINKINIIYYGECKLYEHEKIRLRNKRTKMRVFKTKTESYSISPVYYHVDFEQDNKIKKYLSDLLLNKYESGDISNFAHPRYPYPEDPKYDDERSYIHPVFHENISICSSCFSLFNLTKIKDLSFLHNKEMETLVESKTNLI